VSLAAGQFKSVGEVRWRNDLSHRSWASGRDCHRAVFSRTSREAVIASLTDVIAVDVVSIAGGLSKRQAVYRATASLQTTELCGGVLIGHRRHSATWPGVH
jgi:hypothetical protein